MKIVRDSIVNIKSIHKQSLFSPHVDVPCVLYVHAIRRYVNCKIYPKSIDTPQKYPILPHENDRHAFHHMIFHGHAHVHEHHRTFHDHVHAHGVSLLPFHGEHHHVHDLFFLYL